MIEVFEDRHSVHTDPTTSDLHVGLQWVLTRDPAAFRPTTVPTWDVPSGGTGYPTNHIRAARRMIGSDGTDYLVVASDRSEPN